MDFRIICLEIHNLSTNLEDEELNIPYVIGESIISPLSSYPLSYMIKFFNLIFKFFIFFH